MTDSSSLSPGTASAPSIADGVVRALDPRAVALARAVGWIVTAVISAGLLLIVGLVLLFGSLAGWATAALLLLWAAASLALAAFSQRWPAIEHRHASYLVDERGIEIRKGVYWRQVTHVPRSRIQHTDVAQGPLERSHGLGTLVVHTAGTDHARVELAGLDHATAVAIRDHLLPRSDDDAV